MSDPDVELFGTHGCDRPSASDWVGVMHGVITNGSICYAAVMEENARRSPESAPISTAVETLDASYAARALGQN